MNSFHGKISSVVKATRLSWPISLLMHCFILIKYFIMRFFFTTVVFFLFMHFISAQSFQSFSPQPLIPRHHASTVNFVDVDNDQDMDLFVTGQAGEARYARLYKNDGLGVFTEAEVKIGPPFEGVNFAAIAFADIDGDGDQDLYFNGLVNDTEGITKLYTNDGLGNFTEVNHSFELLFGHKGATFFDTDGDADQDLLITGFNSDTGQYSTRLYINDGTGNFTEKIETPFKDLGSGNIVTSDVDGDGDQDVVLSGRSNDQGYNSDLYINDGAGNFTLKVDANLLAVRNSNNKFFDMDNDGDEDLLIAGESFLAVDILFGIGSSVLYENDGTGNFKIKGDTLGNFGAVINPPLDVADVDQDGDLDVFTAGLNVYFIGPSCSSTIYLNDGTGNFTASDLSPIDCLWGNGAAAFADVDGDQVPDLFLSGLTGSETSYFTRLYKNIGVTTATTFTPTLVNSLEIYPNPASVDRIRVDFSTRKKASLNISIMDMNGQLILRQPVDTNPGENNITVDVSSLVPGMYLLVLNDGDQMSSRKLAIY